MSMSVSELQDYIREIIKQELEEASVTGNLDGGEGPPRTPYAFYGGRKKDKEKKKKIAQAAGYMKVKESVNEAKIKKWKDIPKTGSLDFGKYGRYVILSKNDLRVSGRFVSGSNKGKKVIWYTDKGKTYYRKNRGLKMSQTPSFPFGMVKESAVNEGPDYDLAMKLNKIQTQIFKLVHQYKSKANVPAMIDSFMIGLKNQLKKSRLA